MPVDFMKTQAFFWACFPYKQFHLLLFGGIPKPPTPNPSPNPYLSGHRNPQANNIKLLILLFSTRYLKHRVGGCILNVGWLIKGRRVFLRIQSDWMDTAWIFLLRSWCSPIIENRGNTTPEGD